MFTSLAVERFSLSKKDYGYSGSDAKDKSEGGGGIFFFFSFEGWMGGGGW